MLSQSFQMLREKDAVIAKKDALLVEVMKGKDAVIEKKDAVSEKKDALLVEAMKENTALTLAEVRRVRHEVPPPPPYFRFLSYRRIDTTVFSRSILCFGYLTFLLHSPPFSFPLRRSLSLVEPGAPHGKPDVPDSDVGWCQRSARRCG